MEEARGAIAKYCDLARECFPDEATSECAQNGLPDEIAAIQKQHTEETFEAAIAYLECLGGLECDQIESSGNSSEKAGPCGEGAVRFEELSQTIKCADGELVQGSYCDSNKQCKDGSDEHGDSCFACNDTHSIQRHNVCDGEDHCFPKQGQGEVAVDEADCPKK